MAVTYTNVGNRLLTTFTTSSSPYTSTQVTNAITAARNLIEGEVGSAPDEDNQAECEIIIDVVVQLMKQYPQFMNLFATNKSEGGDTYTWQKEDILTKAIIKKMKRAYPSYKKRSFTVGI